MTPTPVRLFQRQTEPRSNTLQPDCVKQRYGADACAFVLYAPVPLALCPSGERAGRRAAGGRASCLEFSREKVINSAHNGGVTWLDLDCVEERYLLAGAADGSVAAYDVQACPQRTCVQAAEQAACAGVCPAAAHPTPASARGKHRAHSAARLHSLACMRRAESPPPSYCKMRACSRAVSRLLASSCRGSLVRSVPVTQRSTASVQGRPAPGRDARAPARPRARAYRRTRCEP